jgi:hypothetical protein
MAGKTYIKTGDYTWSRVKKIYLKTGGITWQAVRKAYIKTGTSTWKKIYDTASNRPFIANDIPKIRLNTFRNGSTAGSLISGTVNDPVDPVVEAPPVQQMGPSWTSPTYGWPYESLGGHLWGYDGNWTSGNGSTITFIYQWLYNLTGNSNDNRFDPQFYVSNTSSSINTSSTGRADMLTNSASYLGYDGGDYFDKNFLTFRVGASNSAGGPVFSESAPVYIVREVPTGSITMVSPGTAATNSSMAASFTYSNNWYNKTNVSNSYIEWFAVDNLGDSLTNANRVQIEYLSSFVVTGTTSKSGTSFHVPTIANKYYYVKMTLNNSGTENAVIAITGFTPKSSVTSQANKTVATGTFVPAPTSLTATSNRGDGVFLQWDSVAGANYYEIYWQSTTGAGPSNQSTFADFGTNNSITTNSFLDTTISPGATRYYRVRARVEATSNGNNCSDWFPATSSTGTSGFRVKPGPITNPTAYSFTTSTGHGYFTTGTNTDSVQYKLQGITIPIATSVNTISTTSSYPYKVTLNPSSLFTERTWNNDTYSAATTYYANNTVWYAGNQYQSKLISFSGSGTVPSTSGSNTYWTRGSFVGTTPSTSRTWSSSTSYTQGQTVYYGTGTSGASVYEYTANDPGFSGQGPTNTTYWTRITTVTYSVGDYVNYNGTRYYVKISGNGNYPNNTTYWSSTLGTWRFDFTPYFDTAAGDTVYSSSTRDLTLSHTAATEPMTMAAGVSFDNIMSSSFRANYTTGLYANYWYVDIYNTNTNTRISGTPYLTHRSNVTAYTDTVSSGVVPLTNYTYSITPRYYYSISPDVFDNGTGSSNTVTTLAAAATSPTSITAANNGSATTVSISWSGASNASYYRVRWTGYQDTSVDPATYYDKQITASNSTSGSWNWGPSDPDKDGAVPYSGTAYYYHVSSSADGTNWSTYTVSSTAVGTVPIPAPTIISGAEPVNTNTSGTRNFSVTTGSWNNSPTGYSYQWKAQTYLAYPPYVNTINVGTNSSSYSGISTYDGYSIYCIVTATNAGPSSGTATSNAITQVAPGVAPSGGGVTLTPLGTQMAGTVISANVTAMSGTAPITYVTTIRKATGYSPTGNDTATSPRTGLTNPGTGTGNAVAQHEITSVEASGTPDQFKAYTVGSNAYGSFTVGSATVISTPYVAPVVTPSGGTATSTPSTGTAGTTTYVGSTSGWSGSPTSYTYSWQYFSQSSFSYVQYTTGVNFSPPSNINSLYPNYGWQLSVGASNTAGTGYATTSITVNSPAVVTIPSVPTGVSLSGSGAVSWSASSGATSYEIQVYTATNSSGSNRLGPYTPTGITGTSYQLGSSEGYSGSNNYARVQVRARNSAGVSNYGAWVPSSTTYT